MHSRLAAISFLFLHPLCEGWAERLQRAAWGLLGTPPEPQRKCRLLQSHRQEGRPARATQGSAPEGEGAEDQQGTGKPGTPDSSPRGGWEPAEHSCPAQKKETDRQQAGEEEGSFKCASNYQLQRVRDIDENAGETRRFESSLETGIAGNRIEVRLRDTVKGAKKRERLSGSQHSSVYLFHLTSHLQSDATESQLQRLPSPLLNSNTWDGYLIPPSLGFHLCRKGTSSPSLIDSFVSSR